MVQNDWITLKTNISRLSMARVLKPPSQMFGLVLGWDGLSPGGSLGGRVCLSGLRGSEGGWERGGGAVGNGLVGWGILSGGPEEERRIKNTWLIVIQMCENTSITFAQHALWFSNKALFFCLPIHVLKTVTLFTDKKNLATINLLKDKCFHPFLKCQVHRNLSN